MTWSSNEWEERFDVLFNNITSNQAPGLNTYEKSLFLTKAQDEILKNYFNPKGNKYQEGFDGNQKRQIDFSMLTTVFEAVASYYTYTATSETDGEGNTVYTRTASPAPATERYVQAYDENGNVMPGKYVKVTSPTSTGFGNSVYDNRPETKSAVLPTDIMMIVNERVDVTRRGQSVNLTVVPISYNDYDRLMSKPFKRPLKYQAWRLINHSDVDNRSDIIVGPQDTITDYAVRYIRKPKPIIVGDLDGLTLDGYKFEGQTDPTTAPATSGCELDPMLYEEILQRAVELAKTAWTATGQDNTQAVLQAGQRSE